MKIDIKVLRMNIHSLGSSAAASTQGWRKLPVFSDSVATSERTWGLKPSSRYALSLKTKVTFFYSLLNYTSKIE